MIKYSLKRLFHSLLSLFFILTIVFLLLRLMPEEGYLGTNSDKLDMVQREAILKSMGLRDPLSTQLVRFYKDTFSGNLGTSIIYRPKVSVNKILKEKIPYSLSFGIASMTISLLLGISLGIVMAKSKNKFWDKIGNVYIVIINAVPAAVYYLFLQLYLTDILKLPILFDEYNIFSWILPVISMSLSSTAAYAMWMRRYMVDELNKDYIKLARAKGVSERKIMTSHILRNAFVPMAQYLPTSLLYTIAGSIYIESLYSIPGMGGLLVDAISRQDNPLVQSLVLIYASLGIVGLLLGDLAMVLVDPRIKLDKRGVSR